MKQKIIALFFKLTDGRPMKKVGDGFWDSIGGQQVDYYQCKLGKQWMATSPWAWFRVDRELNQ